MIITPQHDSMTLMQQTADRSVINFLFNHGFINQAGRDQALEILYPQARWGAWIAQVLAILGCTFVVAGIIFYFAFNWENMSDYYKLTCIELGIVISLSGSWAFSLNKLPGQLFLTAASILIGVFMAVFGQIYQTGADASTLFITWFIFIIPWALIGNFAPLWFFWVIIVNLALILFWQQDMVLTQDSTNYIFSLLILLNVAFLSLREFFNKSLPWLLGRWHRILLALGILVISMIPIERLILHPDWHQPSLVVSALLGLIVQACFLYYYRKVNFDKWVYALTILCLCLIVCTLGYKCLQESILSETLQWLIMSLITLFVFSTGAFILRK